MSRTKHKWYYFVKNSIVNGYYLQDTEFSKKLNEAIKEAMEETAKLPNGELRLLAIDQILVRHTKTYEGVGIELNYEARTIQTWINNFVNLVGKKAGL